MIVIASSRSHKTAYLAKRLYHKGKTCKKSTQLLNFLSEINPIQDISPSMELHREKPVHLRKSAWFGGSINPIPYMHQMKFGGKLAKQF